MREYLDTNELAERLHIGTTTLIRWRRELEGPPWVRKGSNKFKTGTITTKYVKSKTYPANWVINEKTGKYEAPKE